MLPKIPGDIADTNLILFSSPPMRIGPHISKERVIAQALLIDLLRTDIGRIELHQPRTVVGST